MPLDKVDYAALLSDLEAKKAALEASIASIRSAMALGVLGEAAEGVEVPQRGSTSSGDNGAPVDLPRGALLGKTIPQAITLYLSAVKRRQTNKQITEALKEQGVVSTGKLEQVVTGSLNRMRGIEVLRFDDGWGLTAWYPESFKSKMAEPSGKTPKTAKAGKNGKTAALRARARKALVKGKKGATRDSKGKKSNAEATTAPAVKPATGAEPLGTQERILELLRAHPATEFSPPEVTSRLGLRPQTAPFVLGKLAHKKQIERTAAGTYHWPQGA